MAKNETVSAMSSLAVPGLGQIYNGDVIRGVGWLTLTALFQVPLFITSGGVGNVLWHGLSSYTAYKRAERRNVLESVR